MATHKAIGEEMSDHQTHLKAREKLADAVIVDDQSRQSVVDGNNQFALDLYETLRGQVGNLFFSPYSLSAALVMIYAGARSHTAEQIADVLHFDDDDQRLHPAFASLMEVLSGSSKPADYQLYVANSLWGQRDYGFCTSYLKLIERYYGAGVREVDFAAATEETRQAINSWVEQQTQHKIRELVKPKHIDRLTTLILTNAIYFKGDWAVQFERDQTRDAPFLKAIDQRCTVPMMHQSGEFNYLEEEDFQALALPYVGQALTMLIFLPRQVDGLAEFERKLTLDNLSKWFERLRPRNTNVHLPRFQLTTECELKDALTEMGMPLAFNNEADFSGMIAEKPLWIDNVIHKAFVDVNEEGTEAGAATAVVMMRGLPTSEPAIFRADHPFVFVIGDNRFGSILFLGRLTDPRD